MSAISFKKLLKNGISKDFALNNPQGLICHSIKPKRETTQGTMVFVLITGRRVRSLPNAALFGGDLTPLPVQLAEVVKNTDCISAEG